MTSTDPILNTHGEGSSFKFADSENGAGQRTPANGGTTGGGFVSQARMNVVPPTEDDLQQSYAKVVGSEANPKGWYGSMSRFLLGKKKCNER